MSLYLLDSGIIIDVLNGKRGRLELIQQLLRQGGILASCPTTITEIYAGLRPEEAAKTERFLRSLKFFPLTWEISKQAGDLLCYWRLKGRTLSLPDTTIAAIALSHQMVLITGNQKDFPMPEIKLHALS
jgi:predicted nucleic acid-binding protein